MLNFEWSLFVCLKNNKAVCDDEEGGSFKRLNGLPTIET